MERGLKKERNKWSWQSWRISLRWSKGEVWQLNALTSLSSTGPPLGLIQRAWSSQAHEGNQCFPPCCVITVQAEA